MSSCVECSLSLPRAVIVSHVERYHVGPRSSDHLYRLSCADCSFSISEDKVQLMLEHCHDMRHDPAKVLIDWTDYQKRETARVSRILSLGAETLKGRSDSDISRGAYNQSQEAIGSSKQSSRPLRPNKITKLKLPQRKIESHNSFKNLENSEIEIDDLNHSIQSLQGIDSDESTDTTYGPVTKKKKREPRKREKISRPPTKRQSMKLERSSLQDGSGRFSSLCRLCKKGFSCGTFAELRNTAVQHIMSHAKVHFFECLGCQYRTARKGGIDMHHRMSTRKANNTCVEFKVLETRENMAKMREMVGEAFPDLNYDRDIAKRKLYGIVFE